MGGVREFLQKNPAAGYAIAVLLIAVAGYVLYGQLTGGPTPPAAEQPQPPAATPAPAPAQAPVPSGAPPLPAAPGSISSAVVPPAPAGRVDPFVPLVSPPSSAPARPSPPPGSQLPPPPFPVPGTPLPPPPLPGAPGTPAPLPAPAPPPSPSAGISVSGIVSDTSKVVIVSIGGQTEILFEGESAGDLRVVKIDANRRTVTFERAGQRFDVTMGGG